MKITCYVTARDITRGQKGDCYQCPGAMAINRRLKPGLWTVAGPARIFIRRGPQWSRAKALVVTATPSLLRFFMSRFDSGGSWDKYKPFHFTLSLPPRVLR